MPCIASDKNILISETKLVSALFLSAREHTENTVKIGMGYV
jgi:hypothetical protein